MNIEKIKNRDFINKYNNFLLNIKNERTSRGIRDYTETKDINKNNTKTKIL